MGRSRGGSATCARPWRASRGLVAVHEPPRGRARGGFSTSAGENPPTAWRTSGNAPLGGFIDLRPINTPRPEAAGPSYRYGDVRQWRAHRRQPLLTATRAGRDRTGQAKHGRAGRAARRLTRPLAV